MPEFTIPPGFALVPLEPTPEVLDALRTGSRRDWPSDELCRVRYAAMLGVAQKTVAACPASHLCDCPEAEAPCQKAAPAGAATQAPAERADVDRLAQFIRQIDGRHDMGAGALAEKIIEWLGTQADVQPKSTDPNAGLGIPPCGGPLCGRDHHPLCKQAPAPGAVSLTGEQLDGIRQALLDTASDPFDIEEADRIVERILSSFKPPVQPLGGAND